MEVYGMGSSGPSASHGAHPTTLYNSQPQQHQSMPPPFQQPSSQYQHGYGASASSSIGMSGRPSLVSQQPRTSPSFDGRSSRSPSFSGTVNPNMPSSFAYRPYQLDNGGAMPQTAYHSTSGAGSAANANMMYQPGMSSSASVPRHTGSISSIASGGHTPLRRGQACQACRRRKLKCDAVRPVCGTCEKSRKAAAVANHASPVPDGDCIYDDGPPTSLGGNGAHSSASPPITTSPPATLQQEREVLPTVAPAKRQKTTSFDGGEPRATGPFLARARVSSFGPDRIRLPKREETAEQKAIFWESRYRELEAQVRLMSTEFPYDGRHKWEAGGSFTPWRHRSRANSREPDSLEPRQAVPILSLLSPLSGRQERHRMQYSQRPSGPSHGHHAGSSPTSERSTRSFGVSSPARMPMHDPSHLVQESVKLQQTSLPTQTGNGEYSITDETLMQLLWPGWSSDLPSAEKVTSLCETFFRLHPMRNIVYKPSFMAGLLLPPRHPHRPDDSLIHAILAAAANISPYHETEEVVGIRDKFVSMMSDPFSRPNTQQAQSADVLTFKEFHLSKSRLKVERSLLTDFKNPLDWLSATLICIYVLWYDGRFVESYFLNGFLCRSMAPAGLDKLPSRHFAPDGKVKVAPGIFGTPQGTEEHERRMILWHAFIADQYTSGPPTFYENLLSENAIQVHLPCPESDFTAGNDVAPNHQTLSSPDLFSTGHLDDFTLHIKSAVLLRRASTLASRSQHAKMPGLSTLDKHIDEFIGTFPTLSFAQASSDALNASTNISLALIYLHEPYLTSKSLCSIHEHGADVVPEPGSANGRVIMAVTRVLDIVYQLLNSSFDFALLHPQMFLSWSVAARMLGKDIMALQQRISARANDRNSGVKQERGNPPLLAADEHMALVRVMEALNVILEALKRGGVKCVKARRCAELVGAVRSGNLKESYLAHLLYLDGVIPTGDEDNSSHGTGAPSTTTLMALQPFHGGHATAAHDVLMSLTADGDVIGAEHEFFDGSSVPTVHEIDVGIAQQHIHEPSFISHSPIDYLRRASTGPGNSSQDHTPGQLQSATISSVGDGLAQYGLYESEATGGGDQL